MKTKSSRRSAALVSALISTGVALSGCGSSSSGGGGAAPSAGSLASSVDLKGVTISVGSKEYPEQKILGALLVQSLQAAGAKVKDNTGLNGTNVVRKALTSGSVDVYYEYTGTAWLSILNKPNPINNSQKQFDAVRTADAKNNIDWFALAPFNDSYAIGGTAKATKSTGVTTLSQYAALVAKNPSAAKFCSTAEFRSRSDGLPGVEKTYGFNLPASDIFPAETTVIYQAAPRENATSSP